MNDELPPELSKERDLLIAEIYSAFEGVSREGGVSWSESRVIDAYGSDEERREARRKDHERNWRSLILDDGWNSEPGVGGWCFLDPIAFRYYLPAVLIRSLRSGSDEGVGYWLTLSDASDPDWWIEKWSALDGRQQSVVQRFLRFMLCLAFHMNWDDAFDSWQEALDAYWESLCPRAQ